MVEALAVSEVYRGCPEEAFSFEVTSELPSLDLLSGHDRAREALAFGTAIRSDGFNLFVLGQSGHGMHSLVGHFLEERSRDEPPPPGRPGRPRKPSAPRPSLSPCSFAASQPACLGSLSARTLSDNSLACFKDGAYRGDSRGVG